MSALKKLKKFLKIRDFKKKNIDYSRPRGKTLKSDKKLAEFREDPDANKKLQQESKNPNKNYTTYKRVTSTNKDQYSNQHLKKDEKKNKKKKSGSRTKAGYVRYKGKLVSTRTAQGKNAANRLKAKKRAQEAAKKRLANK